MTGFPSLARPQFPEAALAFGTNGSEKSGEDVAPVESGAIFASPTNNEPAMKALITYSNKEATYTLKNGEVAKLLQDPNGMWGFETNSGYNLWEAPERLSTKRADIIKAIRAYEAAA